MFWRVFLTAKNLVQGLLEITGDAVLVARQMKIWIGLKIQEIPFRRFFV
jgi:hypothetical protein